LQSFNTFKSKGYYHTKLNSKSDINVIAYPHFLNDLWNPYAWPNNTDPF